MKWTSIQSTIAIVLFSIFKSTCVFAADKINNGLFIGAGGSWNWENIARTAHVYNGSSVSPPSNSDLYTISKPNSEAGFSLYAGYRFTRPQYFLPLYSIAFRYTHTLKTKIRGTVEQYSLPDFINYNYTLNFNSDIYSVEAKLDLYQFGSFFPYINMDIGLVNNTVSNYRETAVTGVTPRISPGFKNSTDTGFAYDLGIGIDYLITSKCWASLGYEYANFDKITGVGSNDNWTGQSISLGTLKDNRVLLNIFYQIV